LPISKLTLLDRLLVERFLALKLPEVTLAKSSYVDVSGDGLALFKTSIDRKIDRSPLLLGSDLGILM
jgi:hypothetical protein